MTRKLRLLAFKLCLPVVAVGVLAAQITGQVRFDLTQWKGGGMGMFSTLDRPSNRFTRIRIEHGNETYVLSEFRGRQNELRDNLEILPTDRSFQQLADSVLRTRWYVTHRMIEPLSLAADGQVVSTAAPIRIVEPSDSHSYVQEEVEAFRPDRVTIEFWKMAYDRDTGALSSELVTVRDFEAESGS